MWACDFETHPGPDETWVWAWGACSIENPEEFIYGASIESFMSWAHDKTTLYFHNLKFDGAFIADHLFKTGWKYYHEKPKPNGFSALISDSGQWYSMTINFGKSLVKIYDSLKKLPMSISSIAKAFNLQESKLSLDYSCFRPPNANFTKPVLDYIKADCVILAKALNIQFAQGLKKMTASSDALDFFKSNLPGKFTDLFPVLDLETDKEIRASYRGGWVYCKEPGSYENTVCYDVNSLYPYAMLNPMPYGQPQYFAGEYVPDPDYPLYVISFKADFVIKPNMLPTIQLKHSRFHSDTEYVTQHFGLASEDVITLTSIDFEMFKSHYDILEIEFVGGYKFKQIHDVFKPYIDHWSHIKANSTGGVRTLAKRMLNSLYGKFGKNPNTTRKDLIYDGKIRTKTAPTEFSDPVYIPIASFVTAYARKITISAAQSLYQYFIYADTDSLHLKGCPDNLPIIVHDSDLGAWKVEYKSVRAKYLKAKRYMVETTPPIAPPLCETPQSHTILHTKPRSLPNKSIKNYRGNFDGKPNPTQAAISDPQPPEPRIKITCAGMPDNIKKTVTFETFITGATFPGKLVPKYVPGGVVLCPTTFTLT